MSVNPPPAWIVNDPVRLAEANQRLAPGAGPWRVRGSKSDGSSAVGTVCALVFAGYKVNLAGAAGGTAVLAHNKPLQSVDDDIEWAAAVQAADAAAASAADAQERALDQRWQQQRPTTAVSCHNTSLRICAPCHEQQEKWRAAGLCGQKPCSRCRARMHVGAVLCSTCERRFASDFCRGCGAPFV